ncbi:MAG: DinB family protein [Bacteroidia bacterium]|nr:DinB family protein [Bacteroidia bacterium]
MTSSDPIQKLLGRAIQGVHSHVVPAKALENLTLAVAANRISLAPHTIWQIIGHLNYWWEICFAIFENRPHAPAKTAAEGWQETTSPPDQQTLDLAIQTLLQHTQLAEKWLQEQPDTLSNLQHKYGNGFELLQTLASHQSYHLGQIVTLRQIQGDWPPPSGGESW